MNCKDASPGYDAPANETQKTDSNKSKDNVNLIIILACGVPLILFLCFCSIARYRQKNPASAFDNTMFDNFDKTTDFQNEAVELGATEVEPDDKHNV